MPLHDWTNSAGWDGVHNLWIVRLLHWIKPRLPEGYRAYIGSVPALTVGAAEEQPDVAVRQWLPEGPTDDHPKLPETAAGESLPEPDEEVATLTLDPQTALFVAHQGRLIAALELISPRNKDRSSVRAGYLGRYLAYLQDGVHVLLVDVHRRPVGFSFADALASELQIRQPSCPAPHAVSYRVGEPAATGGRFLGIWRRPFQAGDALPKKMNLALTVHVGVAIDLDETYQQAAADAYLT